MEADNANDIAPTLGGYDGIDGRPDLFRDTPVRFCGYTNELGEAFRSFLSSKAVAATYGAAFICKWRARRASHRWFCMTQR